MNQKEIVAAILQIRSLADGCLEALAGPASTNGTAARQRRATGGTTSPRLDFSKPIRPFMKSYGGGLSGSKKFTLLLSRLAGGDLKKEVSLVEIKRQWKRMTSKTVLGMEFNGFFASDAREQDWVDLRKKGVYVLRPGWTAILRG